MCVVYEQVQQNILGMKTMETVVKDFLNNTFNITAYYVTFKLS